MQERFSRTELLIGKNGLNKLANSAVAIFGAGGVGGYCAEALARTGLGSIDIIDNDKISLSNINRQIYALESTLGKFKVDAAKERILDINPDIKITTHKIFFDSSTEFDFTRFDYIIDAIDTVSSKIELILKAKEFNVDIISSMGAGNKMNPAQLEVADIYDTSVCPLARVMRHELKKHQIDKLKVVYSKESPIKPQTAITQTENKKSVPASNAFVPPAAGLIIASEVVKDLLKEI